MRKTLFQYAIIWHKDNRDISLVKSGESIIVQDVTSVLALNQDEVRAIALRQLTAEQMNDFSNIEIIINQFNSMNLFGNSVIYNQPYGYGTITGDSSGTVTIGKTMYH
jgi:hypothetical protein